MALGKTISTVTGVPSTYWKICNVIEDYVANEIKITLGGYVSAELRQAGASPLACQVVILADTDYTSDMDRAALYTKLKSLGEWADAVDL